MQQFPRLTISSVRKLVESTNLALSNASGWQGHLVGAMALSLPFFAYAMVLRLNWPTSILSASYSGLMVFVVPAGLLLYYLAGRSSWLGTIASLTLILGMFALPLLALWDHVGFHGNAVGGLLPRSDAHGFYQDALRLLDGHPIGWSARRPLFVGLLATLLALTGQNLQAVLAILVALSGIACALLAREIRQSNGATATVIVVVLLFLFYRRDGAAGALLTENLGLPLGVVSLALLWRGCRVKPVLS